MLKNSSLLIDYLGLEPNNDLLNLIFAMASKDPDATIAARAANEYSFSKTNFTVSMNPELAVINTFKPVGDLKFCHHYFPGNISDKINTTYGLANNAQAEGICNKFYGILHPRYSMTFKNDLHVFAFLHLFKQGKYNYTLL